MSYCGSRVGRGLILVFSLGWITSSKALAQLPGLPSSPPKTDSAEEGAVFDRILNRVRFENDWTEVSETEAVVRIQSQAGVEEFGQIVFGCSSETEKLRSRPIGA